MFKEPHEEGHEYLEREEVRDLLIRMGDPLALKNVDKYIAKMTKGSSTVVTLQQFKIHCAKQQPTNLMGTYSA